MRSLEHAADKIQLVPPQQLVVKGVLVPLDRDFPDLLAFTLMSEPGMIQVGTYQYQLRIVYDLYVIAYDAFGSFGIDDEI